MVIFERGPSDGADVTVEFDGGLSWQAHPHEEGQRSSHALRTDAGVWILDPLDAPNVEERIASLGDVAGVAVLSCYHARDADVFARRYDVPVHVPTWMGRVGKLADAPIERYTLSPSPEFRVLPCRPFPAWQEVFWYHEPTATLVVPDSLGTVDSFCVGDERLGLELLRRLQPPTQLSGLDPERILVGHGPGLTTEAGSALAEALDGARWTFPAAARENGVQSVRSILSALR
jgi:hypothetical protein